MKTIWNSFCRGSVLKWNSCPLTSRLEILFLRCIPSYLLTYIRTYIHTYLPTYIRSYLPTTYITTFLHMYVPTYIHNYLPKYVTTFLHTYVHTYLPTHVPTFIPILSINISYSMDSTFVYLSVCPPFLLSHYQCHWSRLYVFLFNNNFFTYIVKFLYGRVYF